MRRVSEKAAQQEGPSISVASDRPPAPLPTIASGDNVASRWSRVRMLQTARSPFMDVYASNFMDEGLPDIAKAKQRARDRLPRDGSGNPHPHLGLVTPIEMVRTLGSDAAFYVRFIQEGVCVTLLVLLVQFPAILTNMGVFTTIDFEAEYTPFLEQGYITGTDPTVDSWTAAGSWPGCNGLGEGANLYWGRAGGNGELSGAPRLSYTQVICNLLAMLIIILFLVRMQRMLLRDGCVFARVAVDLRNSAPRISNAVKGATKCANAGASKAAGNMGAGDMYAKMEGAVSKAAADVGKAATGVGKAATDVGKEVGKKTKMATDKAAAVAKKIVPDWWQKASADMLAKLPAPNSWWVSSGSTPVRVDMAAASCTLVLWGWRAPGQVAAEPSSRRSLRRASLVVGAPSDAAADPATGLPTAVPKEALEMLSEAAGEDPVCVNQARDVYDLTLAWRELTEMSIELCRARVAAGMDSDTRDSDASDVAPAPAPGAASDPEKAAPDAVGPSAKAAAKVAAAKERAKELEKSATELQSRVVQLQREAKPISLAFITFQSSAAAQAAWTCAEELKAEHGMDLGAAPRPTDVVWEHLHVHPAHTEWRVLWIVLVGLVMAPTIAATIIIATAFAQMALPWVPIQGLMSWWLPVQKVIGGSHWIWGVIMFNLAYATLNQLIALTLCQAEAGWVPARLRPHAIKDWYHSMTSGQMHFITIVGLVECLALLVGVLLLWPIFAISEWACNITCLCWWLNPRYRSLGSWYDYGAGLAFNTLVNSFICDAGLNSGAVPLIGRTVAGRLAKSEPTQYLMDQAVRSKDPAYLSWRIVHLIKAWYFAIILMPVVPFALFPLVVYHLMSYFIDRYNMLCALEPLPPSSGLCMRFVVTVALPLIVPLHFLIGFFGFRDALTCGERDAFTLAYTGCVRSTRSANFSSLEGSDGQWVEGGWTELTIYAVVGGALNIYFAIELLYLQRKQAIERGLLTPWQARNGPPKRPPPRPSPRPRI